MDSLETSWGYDELDHPQMSCLRTPTPVIELPAIPRKLDLVISKSLVSVIASMLGGCAAPSLQMARRDAYFPASSIASS